MQKKIIAVIFIAVLLVCSFLAGGICPSRRASELEKRAVEFESQLNAQTERNSELTAGLKNANGKIAVLNREISGLTESNRQLTDKIRNLGTGISEDISTVDGVIEGIQKYIPKTDVLEKSNGN